MGKAVRWTPEALDKVQAAILADPKGIDGVAARMNLARKSIENALRHHRRPLVWQEKPYEVPEMVIERPAPPDMPIKELVDYRIRLFERRQAYEEDRHLITVRVRESLPVGILHFGDPHLDDDGTDLALLKEHAELVRDTPGLYGANVGDSTNNWIGRLARLHSEQHTTAADGWRLAEWFTELVGSKWLYIVAGNHDLWSGAGNPMKWISARVNALHEESNVRIALRFPNKSVVRVNCRHDFKGSSQYNPAHGPMKALFFGVRDHIAIAGHRHESAYGVLKDPESAITMHAIRVASYKVYDRYARESQFRDQHLGPACVTVIDPRLPAEHPDLVKVFWDPHIGAEYLGWLRKRKVA